MDGAGEGGEGAAGEDEAIKEAYQGVASGDLRRRRRRAGETIGADE